MTWNRMKLPAVAAAFGLALGMATTVRAAHHEAGEHAGHEGHAEHAAAPDATLDGEIVDLQCFMGHPENGQGKDHISCAQACMKKGLPIGFLTGDQVYLLLGPGHAPIKDKVVKLAGVPVTLTGTVVDHHGMKAIQMKDVKKQGGAASVAPAPAASKEVWVCPMGCEGKKYDKAGKCSVCVMDLVKQKS